MTLDVASEPGTRLLIRAQRTFDGVVSEPRTFGPLAVELVEESRRDDDAAALVVALRARAWFERSLQHNLEARHTLDDAVTVARRGGLADRLGEVLVSRAAVNLELGRTDAAWRDLRAASAEAPPSPELDYMRAVMLQNLGRLAAAAEAYRRVLAHPDTPPDRRGGAANNLALIDAAHGRYADGLRRIDEVVRAVDGSGRGRALLAYAMHNRSLILAQSGQLAESVRAFSDAVHHFADAGLPLGEFQAEHAETLADLRLLPEARAMADRAASELDAHEVPLMAAEARLTVARVALRSGDQQAAVEAAVDAGARFRGQRRPAWAARATAVEAEASLLAGTASPDLLVRTRRAATTLERAGLTSAAIGAHLAAGRLAESLGRTAVARRSYLASAALPRTGPVGARLESRLAAAHARRLAGDDAGVLRHCRAGLADLAAHRAALGSTELRVLASGHGVALGRLGLRTLLRLGRPSRVLEWMERTRAAALLSVHPPDVDEHRDLLAELGGAYADLAQARRESGTEPADLLARLAEVEERIRRSSWTRAAVDATAPGGTATAAQVRALLGADALAFYGVDGDDLFAVVTRGGRSRMVRLGDVATARFETDALLFALRRLTRPGSSAALAAARGSAEHALGRLRALLVDPLRVPEDTALVVVPAAGTLRLPWSALHPAPVSVTPSMSMWVRARCRPAPPVSGRVVAVAGPGLPGAAAEVHAVAGLHADPAVVATPRATVPATVAVLADADLAHLSCHGRLRVDNPMFSALELDGGELTLHELDVRGIAPRRVVLASCDSAAEVAYDGDELFGFVSALLARGTAGVVASVVLVGDAEAVDLMTDLHRHVAGGASLAVALHRARAAVDRSDPRAFANWCAFTAFGAA